MNRGLLVLVAAGVCGLGTMYFARNALNRGGPPPDPDIDVVVAAKDIKSGSYLNEQVGGEPVIKLAKMKKSAVSPDYFSEGQLDLVSLMDEKSKRWAKYAIVSGEPINKKKLGDPRTRPGMPSEIRRHTEMGSGLPLKIPRVKSRGLVGKPSESTICCWPSPLPDAPWH